ncbi:peptide ABC transporter substrate-binding protein, partial [Staphylococcus aureus]|nr:peptide ABC transporter substrate-binding protein [Staphylococcus aureus]
TGSAQNNTDWGNKEYDQLLKVARTKLALQPNERYENLKKAEEMFLGDAPVAPIYQKGVAHLTNPQVKGLIYHKFGPNNSLKHVYIDKSIDKETGKKKK